MTKRLDRTAALYAAEKRALSPPADMPVSEWVQRHVKLPEGHGNVMPGPINLGITPHLIEPARKRQVEPPGFDPPGFEWLPAVTCICGLEAPRSTRDDDLDLSVLTLIWFQDEYALPIQEDVATAIHLLDWDRLATNIRL